MDKEKNKKNMEMTQSLFANATEGIIVSSRAGIIIMANPNAEKMFGHEKGELIHKTIESLVPREVSKKHTEHRHKYTSNPHARPMGKNMDLFAKRKDDTIFPVEISLSTFKTTEGEFILSFIIDITDRKKQQEEIAAKNRELEHYMKELTKVNFDLEKRVELRTEELANVINELARSKSDLVKALEKEKDLNELKSRFVTTASHEFRTPLTTILSSVSLISKYNQTGDTEKSVKHVDRIKSSVSNLTEILNDFLSLGKLEEGVVRNNPESFEINTFIHSVIEENKLLLKAGQKITYDHSGITTSVHLDKQLTRNIIINLLSNAIKYSPENKAIDITTEIANKRLVLNITDRGIGIPQEEHERLFERFFRAHNSANIQGTGLGLNIVKRYADLMSGKIYFRSKAGEGSTFSVELPV